MDSCSVGVTSLETRLACLEVFALGGHSREDDATDTGYYSLRLAMQIPVASAARHVAVYGMEVRGAPVLVGLMSRVSQRFGVVLSQKLAAEVRSEITADADPVVVADADVHAEDQAA
ncbi:MAG: hypothetical protein RIQ52_252 [Pseudomonadota bacterium]|jgi:hypothetical protein